MVNQHQQSLMVIARVNDDEATPIVGDGEIK
jgi:hypothetical protein